MNKYIAFSGGVESTTMCLLFGADATAIFADTGWEHEFMYKRIDKVIKVVKQFHPSFKFIKVKNRKYGSLQDYISNQKFYPSPLARYCTRMFKIEPIDEFLKSKGQCELMIGLNADETARTGNHEKLKNVKYTYPLIKANLNRDKCIEILKYRDLVPEFPPYMQRGGCIGCFYKSKKEFISLYHLNKSEFKQVETIEKSIQDKRIDYYGIRSGIPSMKQLRKECDGMIFKEELYDDYKSDIGTPCGVYCHR